jgi:sodium-dependent phosphate transporter
MASPANPVAAVPPNQVNHFTTIQFPINYNQQGFNPVYGPFPPYEFGVNGKAEYSYYWIYIVACIGAFALAASNGANDVANSFATSVGSKSLKMWHAVIIASICEFAGAALLGSRVAATIRSGIASPQAFVNHDDLLMFGMMVAILVVTVWVFIATSLEMPVSITHSIIGAIIGFSLCSPAGGEAVKWNAVGLVVASWFISPAISGIISFLLFTLIRFLILRHENAFSRVLYFFPFIVFLTVWVNVVFIIFKGGIASVSGGKGSGVASGASISVGAGFGIACAVAGAAAIIVGLVTIVWIRRNVGNMSKDTAQEVAREHNIIQNDDEAEAQQGTQTPVPDAEAAPRTVQLVDPAAPTMMPGAAVTPSAVAAAPQPSNGKPTSASSSTEASEVHYSFIDRMFHQKRIDDAAKANARVEKMHAKAEKFDVKVELAFSYLQIFTACFASFAHGSNDVANSVGPLSAVVAIYNGGPGTMQRAVANKGNVDVPIWVLFVGCSGLVVGLSLYGHIIIAGESGSAIALCSMTNKSLLESNGDEVCQDNTHSRLLRGAFLFLCGRHWLIPRYPALNYAVHW